MSKTGWTRVAQMDELKDGIPISVTVDKTKILLIRLNDTIYALSGKCPHYGAPLSGGLLCGEELTCPWHHARFDITSGKLNAPPALDELSRFPLKVENGKVYVSKPDTSTAKPFAPAIDDTRIFAILGAGAAGNAAAETLRREGYSGRILLITAENRLPYDRPTLSKDFLSGKVSPKRIPLRDSKFYEDLNIEILTGRQTVQLRPKEHKLIFADGDEIEFDQALLATGGIPRKIPIPGSLLPNVFLLRTMDDAELICKAAEKSDKAIILGAGFIGLEAAASLRVRGLKVDLAAPEEIPLQKVFGDQIGQWFQEMHRTKGVQFHLGVTAKEIERKGGSLRVHLSDGSSLDGDLVIGGLGIDPAVGYLRETNLLDNGAVAVDECLQTKAQGIFAAGDIALSPDRHTGEMRRVEHWVVAESQGKHAARAMLGSRVPYAEIPFFWTRQYERTIKFIGHAPSFDQIAFRGPIKDDSFFAGYFREGKLIATASLNGGIEFIALGELLRAGIPPSFMAFENLDWSLVEALKHLA